MKIPRLFLLVILLFTIPPLAWSQPLPDAYNLAWTSPSKNAAESMPCGGGDIGLNVWVENGELLFYIARSGAFDENNTLLKLGRVRVKLSPNVLIDNSFRQELRLQDGSIKISCASGNTRAEMVVWVDAFEPVIHLELESNRKIVVEAVYENWRFEDHIIQKNEGFGNSYKWAVPEGLITKKDQIAFEENSVLFYHHNQGETVFDVAVRQQQLEAIKGKLDNPLRNRTFGGKMQGPNFIAAGKTSGRYLSAPFEGWKLQSKTAAKKHRLDIFLHTGQYENTDSWLSGLNNLVSNYKNTHQSTKDWWAAYWQRSFIQIKAPVSSAAWQVGRNYQLFRYMLACNATGEYPTKFNGGLFTYDPELTDTSRRFNPDYRNWGGGTFTAQNQRLVYFPMLKSGDFDLLKPQLDYYKRLLNNAEQRSRHYWGHAGACFTEQLENFGLPNPSEYGWKRPADFDPGLQYNAWLEYQWDSALEFCWMALQLQEYAGADIAEYLPLIESCLTFFDAHYQYLAAQRGRRKLDADGHLVLYPGSACETYKMAYNPTSTIAALKSVTEGLLQLPEPYLDSTKRAYWQAFLERIPPLNFREIDGFTTISPAKLWERINNTEAPQLYPVYPWGLYGVGKPDLDLAVHTYRYDPEVLSFQDHKSWKQYNIFAARLGLTAEAEKWTLLKLQDSGRRFPAFWGPGFDWTPDHNWGGSGMIGLQEMLLQTNGDSIYLLPAWPKDWDVHFKLHAPGNTTLEAEYHHGNLEILDVHPADRRKDITVKMGGDK